MALVNCPECDRQISTEAEACPQCGYPMRVAAPVDEGPTCYACTAPATTRCHSCGKLSCALHLRNIFVSHGRGGAYELRCESCYSSAMVWKVVGFAIAAVVLVFILLFWLSK